MVELQKMGPEDRVNAAISMSSVVARICIDSIRDHHPNASNQEIISEARRRIMYGRVIHHEV